MTYEEILIKFQAGEEGTAMRMGRGPLFAELSGDSLVWLLGEGMPMSEEDLSASDWKFETASKYRADIQIPHIGTIDIDQPETKK